MDGHASLPLSSGIFRPVDPLPQATPAPFPITCSRFFWQHGLSDRPILDGLEGRRSDDAAGKIRPGVGHPCGTEQASNAS